LRNIGLSEVPSIPRRFTELLLRLRRETFKMFADVVWDLYNMTTQERNQWLTRLAHHSSGRSAQQYHSHDLVVIGSCAESYRFRMTVWRDQQCYAQTESIAPFHTVVSVRRSPRKNHKLQTYFPAAWYLIHSRFAWPSPAPSPQD
jgi:hypothetical protein